MNKQSRSTFKKFVPLIIILIFLISNTSVFAIPDLVAVTVPNIVQQENQWCWNASSVALLYTKGISITQSNLCYSIFGNYNNQAASMSETLGGIQSNGYSSAYYSAGAFSASSLRTQLYAGKAVMACINYQNGEGAHLVVISGHENSTSTLEYMDPGPGAKYYMNFSLFVYNADFYWGSKIY